MERSGKMWQALILLALLAIVLAYAVYPYISAFFGAFILYAVFKPLYRLLTCSLRIKPGISALSVIFTSILLILIPLYIVLTILFLQIQVFIEDVDRIDLSIELMMNYIDHISNNILPVEIGLRERLMEIVAGLANSISIVAVGALSTVGERLIEFIIMYFVLYYLLVGDRSEFAQSLQRSVPFSRKNREELLRQFPSLVKALLLSSGIIAILQGTILAATFLLLGIEGAFFWGFATAILSFLPVIGVPIIWVPNLALQIMQGDMFTAAGVLVGGIVHTIVDEVLRPSIQKRTGHIHPLITLIGVIAGLKVFGLLGIIIGPILISYVLLVARMFHEEYLSAGERIQGADQNGKAVEEGSV